MSAGISNRQRVGSALKRNAFTLLELMVVVSIIAILMVLVVPAFTNLKSAGDVTSAAYAIKSVRPHVRKSKQYLHLGWFL